MYVYNGLVSMKKVSYLLKAFTYNKILIGEEYLISFSTENNEV